jgi:predicted dehydrogenase
MQEAVKAFGEGTQGYVDYRELIARPDIDAVVIGTPDHWHAVMAIAAMRAGKHVYCEKPLTHNVAEGVALSRVARETGRAFQVGSQQRSDGRFRLACEVVRNGRIGKIKRVEARLPGGSAGGPFPEQPYPQDLDWNRWLGPSPYTEYVKERTHGSWRHWYEYAGGMVADWGAHHYDITQWALGTDDTGPVSVQSKGTFPPQAKEKNAYNTPTEYEITYVYATGIPLVGTNKGENGVRFEGENGWIFVSRGKIEASDKAILEDALPANAVRLYKSDDHAQNFVDGVRNRKECICPAEVGHRSASVCHLGNISLRLGGRKLEWDPKREEFKDDREANALRSRVMRRPWAV